MTALRTSVAWAGGLCLAAGAVAAAAADWPQWGGHDDRNMVCQEKNLPASFVPGNKRPDGRGIDLSTARNVLWAVKLGTQTYGNPTVSQGRVFVGTNDVGLTDPRIPSTGGGLVKCLDAASGQILWQLFVPRLNVVKENWFFDNMLLGVCSSPTVDGDRVYLVTNRCEVLCLDVHGLAYGNHGPFYDEARYFVQEGRPPVPLYTTDADIVWRYDMVAELSVWPHDASNCSVLVHGDYLYVNTSNGQDKTLRHVPSPDAPTLIALDKRTGRLVARDEAGIGKRIFHGQWSSPSLAAVDGKPLIFIGGGDGICYAFEPAAPEAASPEAASRQAAQSPRPVTLKNVWSCDCNPPEFRVGKDGKPLDYCAGNVRNHTGNKGDGSYVGPSEIIATPVCHDNRVYVAIGQDPLHGHARGMLTCIDATGRGDISRSGKLWTYGRMERSLSTVAIVDGLLYIADFGGVLHCLDAETGRVFWTFPTGAETWASPLVADGKIYLGTKKSLWVLSAGRTPPKVLAEIHLGAPVWCTPVVADGVLYVASERYLWAVKATVDPAQTMNARSPVAPTNRWTRRSG